MATHTHRFVEEYKGLVGFGLDRPTDESTLMVYLQKFSDDALMGVLLPRLSDAELSDLFDRMNRLMRRHLSEGEYHRLFLKEE
ncbi:MAG: cytoplasmic protein [Desulfobacterales bacterium]|jgi:hypothetical protein|nr:cytoplasmic protein [Desulfobacterales bacterium]